MTALFVRVRQQVRTVAPGLVRAVALRTAVLTAAGYLVGGPGGALIAGLATVIAAYEPRLIALYALVGVVFTGVLTVIESPTHGGAAVSSFVSHRPVTGIVGRLAGLVFLVAVVCLWRDERTIWRSPDALRPPSAPRRSRLRSGWTRRLAPVAVFCLGVALVLNLAGDRSLRWVAVPLGAVVLAVGGLAWRERRSLERGVAAPLMNSSAPRSS